jgi:phosphoribosylformylglycinamidine (FGAM) synthase PurS component
VRNPLKFYLAGKYQAKERLREMRQLVLERTPDTCVSRWLDHNLVEADVDDQGLIEEAWKDITDVKAAKLFILDTEDESVTGGRDVEYGIALANPNVHTIVIGPERNIFHKLADMHFTDWLEYVVWLESK